MTDQDKIITDQDINPQPTKGAGKLDGKFWSLIVAMVAVIAIGGVLLS